MKPARLLLGNVHALILTGIRTLLEPYYEVVGSAGDGRSLVGAALRLRPDQNVGMIERGNGPGFALETVAEFARRDLDGDGPA